MVLSDAKLRPLRALPPFRSYPLVSKAALTPTSATPMVKQFLFSYPGSVSFSPATHHIKVVRPGPHKPRSYTPIYRNSHDNILELIVKIYPGGNSEWLDTVSIGTRVTMIGPLPLPLKRQIYDPKRFVCVIALGIGITNGFPVVEKHLEESGKAVLIHAVRYKHDVVMADEIEHLKQRHGGNLTVLRIASAEHEEGWLHGRIDESVLSNCMRDYCGASESDVRFHVVGTKDMIRSIWNIVEGLGYSRRKHAIIRKLR